MATQRVSDLGTSLTPGFTELLSNWDQVLKSLDRVSAYTAERAQEEPSARLTSLRSGRPQLFGETPDGSEWQSLQKPGGYPSKVVPELPEHLQEPRFSGIELGSVRQTGCGGIVLDRFERRVAQQEAQNLLQLMINCWRSVKASGVKEVAGEEAHDVKTEREKLHRLQEMRRSRCTDALRCWQQVQSRDTLSTTFQVWREEIRRQAEVLQKERISQSTLDAAQASEVQCELRRELEKSRAAEEAAAAEASSARMALHVAEEELARLRPELATSNQLLQVKQAQAPMAPMASTAPVDAVKESERSRQMTDLSIKLARAEAEVSEVKSQVEPLTAQLGMARRQLEVAYALLNKEKGNTRDRDLAVTHLWQVLERLQEVPHPEEKNEKKLGLSDSPSAMSTPNIQSSLSLPSLSSASSPSVRSRSNPTGGGPEPSRERAAQRWTAPWS